MTPEEIKRKLAYYENRQLADTQRMIGWLEEEQQRLPSASNALMLESLRYRAQKLQKEAQQY